MITLRGTYADECNGPLPDKVAVYKGRVFPWGCEGCVLWVDGLGRPVVVEDGDVLLVCGDGSWFAHYGGATRESESAALVSDAVAEALADLGNNGSATANDSLATANEAAAA